ncbi:uncharacterized protein LOC125900989 [Epinephelus fuscoguttatus]|uniref:uncharacterized protein LOC125900989 n=1 Tax=Epinephelus fuscoguttatus TaxID=293821 RepID=UPI0020D01383|nr:uncharacterized protein LOC125900989 [Epinephelus fuscoguttatus]
MEALGSTGSQCGYQCVTDEQIFRLIDLCVEHKQLFTGRRGTAKKAWREIMRLLGVEGKMSPAQVSKKWDNLKIRYKKLSNPPTGTGTDGGEDTAATWPFFPRMHKATGTRPSIKPPVLMDSCDREDEPVAAVFSRGPTFPGAATCGQACEEEEEEEEEDAAQPGTSGSTTTQGDDGPSTSDCPQPKRQRTTRGTVLAFLKDEAAKDNERLEDMQRDRKRFLDLFEEVAKKF